MKIIEYLRSAIWRINYIKTINEPITANRGELDLIEIKLTERSDLLKYSICNLQYSIPVRPAQQVWI